jgi:hypothetical protein
MQVGAENFGNRVRVIPSLFHPLKEIRVEHVPAFVGPLFVVSDLKADDAVK